MNDLIPINYNGERPTVMGRELHKALEVKTKYTDWFKRMCEYDFTENSDFTLVSQFCETNNPRNPYTTITDHQLTIPMAKEICMLQRTEIGRTIRRYFIAVEEQWNSPNAIMARAYQISQATLKQLEVKCSELTVECEIMRPKADYFDTLVESNLLTGIRETAKELQIKQNAFVAFLLEKKYLYRDKRGKLMPYAKHVENGLFVLKEFVNEKTGFSSTQLFITPKGKETFRLLLLG